MVENVSDRLALWVFLWLSLAEATVPQRVSIDLNSGLHSTKITMIQLFSVLPFCFDFPHRIDSWYMIAKVY